MGRRVVAGNASNRGWLLDVDGTLYFGRPVRLALRSELAFASPNTAELLARFDRELEVLRCEMIPRRNTRREQIERTAAALGRTADSIDGTLDYWTIERLGVWARRFRRRSLLTALSEFRSRGGLSAAVSDNPARRKLELMGATSLFDVIVDSSEQPAPMRLKPQPDSYLRAAADLGLEPSACLVIGDRWDTDGESALRAGMPFRAVSGFRRW